MRIDEMISNINDSEVIYEDGCMDEKSQKRIYNRVIDKIHEVNKSETQKRKESKRFSRKKITVYILAATMFIGTIAYAATENEWNIRLAQHLNLTDTKQLKGGSVEIGMSDTDNDVTVEAVYSMGDRNTVYIMLEVVFPEALRFDNKCSFKVIRLDELGENYAMSWYEYEDDIPFDNKKIFMLEILADNINTKNIKIKLEDLYMLIGEHKEIGSIVVEGEWTLSWKYNYTANVKKELVYQLIKADGYNIFVEKIMISPISVKVLAFRNPFNDNGDMDVLSVNKVVLQDGTQITEFRGASGGNSNNFRLDSTTPFVEPINVKEIHSVWINNKEIIVK